MHISFYVYDLWYIQLLLTAAVLLLMWRKRLFHKVPYFTLYLFFDLITFPIAFVLIHGKYKYYFWGASVLEFIEIVLVLLILKQLYLRAMQQYAGFRAFGDTVFKIITAVLAVSVIVASLMIPFQEKSTLLAFKFTLEEIVYSVTVGFVILLTLMARYLGVRFNGFIFGIALGFGIYAGLNLLAVSLRRSFGFAAAGWIQMVLPLAAAAVTRTIWLVYALLPKQAEAGVPVASAQLSSWNLALSELMSLESTTTDRTPALH